ncbi:hypothetical protein [Paractinoplanes maris]|uniref:hypothetical protein n=1 Tax=Paractinoplanes maris TaxID=1734446 RepID=UPI00202280D4|nr:hypothetical protein [Actinoplanes maris]
MRKLWYAGAALSGGIILFGASPAQADLLPGVDAAAQQADERLADLLGQSNGVNVDNPLGHSTLKDTAAGQSPVARLKTGPNSPDLDPLLPGEPGEPGGATAGGQRRGLVPRESRDADVPPAGVVRRPGRTLPLQDLPIFGSGGLPLLSGLMPNGQVRDFSERPTRRQAERFDGGVPLLGGLGGLFPANDGPRTLPATGEPDVSGMPDGGVAILPAAKPTTAPTADAPPAAAQAPASSASAASAASASAPASAAASAAERPTKTAKPTKAAKPVKPHKPAKPKSAATPDDPRLHEEPVEPVDAETDEPEHREFSSEGRPVAGVDEQYQ